MKITFLVVGKTVGKNLIEMIDEYVKRLRFYTDFEMVVIPDLKNNKNMSFEVQKEKEGEMILRSLNDSDEVILMDESNSFPKSSAFMPPQKSETG